MHLLVPAASAALVAVMALSAASAVPSARAPSGPSDIQTDHPPRTQRSIIPGASRSTAKAVPDPGLARNTSRVAPRAGFVWPLSPRPAVLHLFEQPVNQWSPGHRGVDLAAAVYQPVLSAAEGVVAFSGVIAGRGVITIRHPGGVSTTYEPVDRRLASGTAVHRAARIGVLAPTAGHCLPRTCLHWGARSGQSYLDPMSLLGFGRPVLLPLG